MSEGLPKQPSYFDRFSQGLANLKQIPSMAQINEEAKNRLASFTKKPPKGGCNCVSGGKRKKSKSRRRFGKSRSKSKSGGSRKRKTRAKSKKRRSRR